MQQAQKHVVVLGCGFGGLEFCKHFKSRNARLTVIDRQNHHLFQPLLYQVATAGLSAPDIAQPIRLLMRDREDVQLLQDEVVGIDLAQRSVKLRNVGEDLRYDYLVIALGARTNYFGHDEWEEHAPGLKSLDDATRIRHNVLLAFEEAERTDDPELRRRLMTIAVIGGGPTGLELAGSFAELTRCALKRDFRRIDPTEARVVLVEALPRILPQFSEESAQKAIEQLRELGVEIQTGRMVKDIQKGKLVFEDGELLAENIIWGAGVSASPLTKSMDVETDRGGRIKVEPNLSIPGHPEAFAIGDIISLVDAKGVPVPGVSPAAMQAGRHVARILCNEIARNVPPGRPQERPAFIYKDKGQMATIGRSKAVAQIGKLRFSGFLAWLTWLFVHLIYLIGFRNRVSVLFNWFYHYLTYRPGARIITGMDQSFTVGNEKARPALRGSRNEGAGR